MIRVWSWRLVCSTVQTASRITWQNTPDRCRPAGVHQSGIMYYILILRLVCLNPPKSRVSVHSYKIDKHNISHKLFFSSVLNFYNELFKNHNKTNSKLKLNPLSVAFSTVSLYRAVNFVSDPE